MIFQEPGQKGSKHIHPTYIAGPIHFPTEFSTYSRHSICNYCALLRLVFYLNTPQCAGSVENFQYTADIINILSNDHYTRPTHLCLDIIVYSRSWPRRKGSTNCARTTCSSRTTADQSWRKVSPAIAGRVRAACVEDGEVWQ